MAVLNTSDYWGIKMSFFVVWMPWQYIYSNVKSNWKSFFHCPSMYIKLLDYLKLRLDFLFTSLLYTKRLIKADIDTSKVKPGCVQPAIPLNTSLIGPSVAFLCRVWEFSSHSITTRSGKVLICKRFLWACVQAFLRNLQQLICNT